MTWSIVARDPATGAFGIAVATRFFAVGALTGSDPGRAARQLHVQDAAGRIAAFTGEACMPWCGQAIHEGFSVAGNMLAGPEVIGETACVLASAPSLGSMPNTAQRFLTQAPWMAVFPGLAIFVTVLAFNLLGDGLRDALDPKS